VYKDFEILKSLNQPLSKKTLSELHNSDFRGANFYLKGVLDENSFPKAGISIYFSAFDEPKLDTLKLLSAYFKSYNTSEIIVIEKNDNELEVKFLTFNGIKLYAQRLGRLLLEVMTIEEDEKY
jgi:hypothetical protein